MVAAAAVVVVVVGVGVVSYFYGPVSRNKWRRVIGFMTD